MKINETSCQSVENLKMLPSTGNKLFHTDANSVFIWMFAGFLTAMRQEVTRANKGWALDTVTLNNKVLKHTKEEIKASPTVS